MIIITGPGRSGTSLVASLYLELGFDPGGTWSSSVNAGLEADDVVRMNERITKDLGLAVLGPPRDVPQSVRRIGERLVPLQYRRRIRSKLYRLPILSSRQPGFMRWDRFDDVVKKYGPELRELSRAHEVVKDPQFCWTLGVWAAAGVEIEHVLICIRSLDAMVQSRIAAGHLRFRSKDGPKNSFVYGLGLCMMALYDYQLAYNIVRFPDFIEDPEQLFAAIQFPRPVSHDQFLRTIAQVKRPELVHDKR